VKRQRLFSFSRSATLPADSHESFPASDLSTDASTPLLRSVGEREPPVHLAARTKVRHLQASASVPIPRAPQSAQGNQELLWPP
jgi:hypothetical protein